MRYLAEIISPDTIAVWAFNNEDCRDSETKEDMLDGIHELMGEVKYPLFDNPVTFKLKSSFPAEYFLKEDYKKKAEEWIKEFHCTPPIEWIGGRNAIIKENKGEKSKIGQLISFDYDTDVKFQKAILDESIKREIIEQFGIFKYNCRYTHQVYKTLVLITR